MFRDIFILFVIDTVHIRSTGTVAFPVRLYQNNLLRSLVSKYLL